jgi:hypothetical protein
VCFGVEDLKDVAAICVSGDFKRLEGAYIVPDTRIAPKRWSRDLVEEWTMLLRQYGPTDALCFAVPVLTPYLRRGIEFDKHFTAFNALWERYEDHLIAKLSTRWLLSTLDTYAKSPRSEVEQGWAFAGALFMKTIEVYETELLRVESYPELPGKIVRMDPKKLHADFGRIVLFEDSTPFNIEVGDMIDKMAGRLSEVKSDELCYKITMELWRRAHVRETAYRRIAQARRKIEETRAARQRRRTIQASAARGVFVREFEVTEGKVRVFLPEGMPEKPVQEIRPSCHPDAQEGDIDLIVGTGKNTRVFVVLRGCGQDFSIDDVVLVPKG